MRELDTISKVEVAAYINARLLADGAEGFSFVGGDGRVTVRFAEPGHRPHCFVEVFRLVDGSFIVDPTVDDYGDDVEIPSPGCMFRGTLAECADFLCTVSSHDIAYDTANGCVTAENVRTWEDMGCVERVAVCPSSWVGNNSVLLYGTDGTICEVCERDFSIRVFGSLGGYAYWYALDGTDDTYCIGDTYLGGDAYPNDESENLDDGDRDDYPYVVVDAWHTIVEMAG